VHDLFPGSARATVPADVWVPPEHPADGLTVEGDAGAVENATDDAERIREGCVRAEGGEQRVVLSAAQRRLDVIAQRFPPQIDAHSAGPGQPGGVEGKTVGDVEHGGGTGNGRIDAGEDGRRRRELSSDQPGLPRAQGSSGLWVWVTARIDRFVEEESQPGGGRARVPGKCDDVTWPRAAPQHRLAAFEVPECGDRESEGVRNRHVSPDDAAPWRHQRAGIAQPGRDALEHTDRGVQGRGDGDDEASGPGAHRGDVGEVRRSGLPAEVVRLRPGQAEVGAVDHHVGGDDEPPIRSGEHRGVVPRAEKLAVGDGQEREDAVEHRQLVHVAHGVELRLPFGLLKALAHAFNGSLRGMSPRTAFRSLARTTVLVALLTTLLTGCVQAVPLDAAENANDPACADVTVRLPDTVADKPKRETSAQATGAWGNPAAVLLHCGVAVPGPTTDACIALNGIDWIADDSEAATNTYRYTTYGRDPAVEVVINADPESGGVSGTTALIDLTSAVSAIPATSECLAPGDVLE
jgi:hypothetical protein